MATSPRHSRTEENWPRVRAMRPATAEKEVPAPNPSMRIPGVAKRERRSRRVLVARMRWEPPDGNARPSRKAGQ